MGLSLVGVQLAMSLVEVEFRWAALDGVEYFGVELVWG